MAGVVVARTSELNGGGSVKSSDIDIEFVEFIEENGETSSAGDHSPSESKENVSSVNGAVFVNGTNERIKWRARRPSNGSGGKFQLSRTNSDSQVNNAPIRALKNSRKSRTGFGRGLPKKG